MTMRWSIKMGNTVSRNTGSPGCALRGVTELCNTRGRVVPTATMIVAELSLAGVSPCLSAALPAEGLLAEAAGDGAGLTEGVTEGVTGGAMGPVGSCARSAAHA